MPAMQRRSLLKLGVASGLVLVAAGTGWALTHRHA
jgi:hypothetical protein